MNIALLLAAGSSSRFEHQQNKLFYCVDEKPLIYYTIKSFQTSPLVDLIVIVTKIEYVEEIQKIVQKNNFDKVMHIVLGGKTRQESSFLGLKFVKTLAKDEDLVLIHDAARPFVSNQLIENLINKAATHQAVVPYLKQVETTFVTFDEQTIGSYLKREKLFRLQTPQVFNLGLIYQAHSKIKKRALSDDSQILFRLGKPIYYIKGEEENLKVTTENDLKLVRQIILEKK